VTAYRVLSVHLRLLLNAEPRGRQLVRLVVGGMVLDAVAVTAMMSHSDDGPPILLRLLLKPDGVLELE
jgi:hypothetical protein